ncbi:EGF-like domain-containing protein [Caenorhabditis elegans]|uniref:EGF-like domain-containing protein n=1 Tax=Caenorhabditis elegans TaxID=6239 RepID=Q7Z1P7_CAEEL|nr:EGF-like domain-containing protein [Caenorhabditis elegans]CCD70855.2 EGF-like domain-containing protein [Caenorhabditis elegans]|eukprot:NP_001338801.1 Uncharacterized protein CELE_R08E3.1 [Caenorhabditis elegans]
MKLKFLLGLLFICWRSAATEEYTNHWLTEDTASVQFCSHDGFLKDGSCVCTADYNSNSCLKRKCRNFGFDGQSFSSNKVDRCICPPGFLGRNCEPVKCVPGSNQAYSSSNSEKSISLLASFNTKMAETWQTGNIGNLFCEKEGYWRSFNYNYDNAGYTSSPSENTTTCTEKVQDYLTPDPCQNDYGNATTCGQLDINNLNSLVQNSPPNSIVFVVTNMGVIPSSATDAMAEDIIATSIARRIQINVIVYNNTDFLSSDSGLAYLSNITSATFGTYILPSIKPTNEQYDIVNTLLKNWVSGIQVSTVFSDSVKNLPVDNSLDLFVAAQTNYGQDLTFNTNSAPVIRQTDFWKLYKLSAETYGNVLSISGQLPNTPVYVYSSGGLIAYSAFTSDDDRNNSVVDSAYSVSVIGSKYTLVVRLESQGKAFDNEVGMKFIGTSGSITLGADIICRIGCQFNYQASATCNSVGASVATVVTADNPRRSVSFPIYCASLAYASSKYNNISSETVGIAHLEHRQSLAKDFTCSNASQETFGQRSFVILAENTKDTDVMKSSVDNVFRNKNSIFYQLSPFVNSAPPQRYANFFAVLNKCSETAQTEQSSDYGTFLTKVMNVTSKSQQRPNDPSDPVKVTNFLPQAIAGANAYSDILLVINYNVSTITDNDATEIKSALEKQRSRLYILFVQTYFNYTDTYYAMNKLAIASGGVAIRVNTYDDLSTFFAQYFPLLVANDIVAKAYAENPRPGVALNNVNLLAQQYVLLVTNEDSLGDGPVPASVTVTGINVTQLPTIGELQLFTLIPEKAGVFNIPILFATSGFSQYSNAVLLASTTSTSDFISLKFVDSSGNLRNDAVYNGKFTPLFYSSSSFDDGSKITITYSDATNPANPIYNGNITSALNDCKYYANTKNYAWACSISGGLYHFKIDRVLNGETISRTFPITCLGADVGDCLNGGNLTDAGSCICPLQWTGTNCQAPQCLNGGTLKTDDTCACLDSFKGDFCETSTSVCAGAPTSPDYRSELSSLVIVADVNALSTSSLSNTVPGITGVPITVILYGDGNAPRIVQSTTNSEHLSEVLGAPTGTTTSPSSTASPAPSASDMYKALNLALDNQLTDRAFVIVYTSNSNVTIDPDFLIRLAVRRAEVRVLSTSGTESQNSITLSLVGNGIPIAINGAKDFENYLTYYVVPLFQSLQYQVNTPQRVFNVFQTGQFYNSTQISIPADSTFDNAKPNLFVHVYEGRINYSDPSTNGNEVGNSTIYFLPYDPTKPINLIVNNNGTTGYYAIEVIGYLKTSYGFNIDNANGSNENLNSGVVYNQQNTLNIYSAPFSQLPKTDPSNFPYLTLGEIASNGTVLPATTVLFTRKSGASCFYSHFTVLDVCSQSTTIGYQAQLTTRTSTLTNRIQQFVLTCFKTSYANNDTSCHGHGSPMATCACNADFGGIDCTEPACVNGGVRDGSVCRCPVRFYGLRCEESFESEPASSTVSVITSTTMLPSTSTVAPSTSQSTIVSTVTTQSPSPSTTAPKQVRAAAFIIDCMGTDDYAFNQTFKSIAQYFKTFGYSHYIMLTNNLNGSLQLNNGSLLFEDFQQYSDESMIMSKLPLYWSLRATPSRTASVSNALSKILASYNRNGTEFKNSVSMNIFYATQIGLGDEDPTAAGLEVFNKSAIVYSAFAKNANQTIVTSLQKFSTDVTTARDYYSGLSDMYESTQPQGSNELPPKPDQLSCVYGLQSNIKIAIDRSNSSNPEVNTIMNNFLVNFRLGFNYIENDDNRCGDKLPEFYTGRTALTAFPYYDAIAKIATFCPSQYTSMLSFQVVGSQLQPNFTDKYVKVISKNINSADCSCNRFNDTNTAKFIIWMPRSAAPVTDDDYLTLLKLNTTNAYHFVVPFYDSADNVLVFYTFLRN